jgi:Ca2+-binding EF-hand superfamily protein
MDTTHIFDFLEVLEALKESLAKERLTHLVSQVFGDTDGVITEDDFADLERELDDAMRTIYKLKRRLQ